METHSDVEAQTQSVDSSSSRKLRRCPPSVSITEENESVDEEKKPNATKYGDTSATYWKLYMSEAEISDKKFVESLMGDTKSMVFLNSLFSAIVGSFIIEIYKTLLPDNSQRTVDLLSQLVSQSSSTQSPSLLIPSTQSFTPPWVAVRINIVLFLSFFLSMMSAVGCSLIQQWCHEYMKYAYPRAAPHESGRVRTYLFQGLDQFQMRRFMYGTHVLLHTSVFLFFLALSDFFSTVHPLFGNVTRYCLVAASVVYMALSISSLIFGNSPYSTPLTPPLRACGILLVYAFRIISRQPLKLARHYFKGIRFDRAQFLIFKSEKTTSATTTWTDT
ncbi:hypothetical protein BC826DRAFT_1113672 [Russula brevipes]|nr:hypothetical protein BC826DRAFT_1113672 [Russula brevipes]